jgi:hypothetical protein
MVLPDGVEETPVEVCDAVLNPSFKLGLHCRTPGRKIMLDGGFNEVELFRGCRKLVVQNNERGIKWTKALKLSSLLKSENS